ncbi:NAD(P)-dependent oxidoreductase [Rhodovibrionaceae bacterium A322]
MTVLLLETIAEEAEVLLKKTAKVLLSPSPKALDHDLPLDQVTAIVTRGLGRVDQTLMDRCPKLQVIARCGAGLNNLDLEHAANQNLPVVFAPGINAGAVAEQSLMLMLMALRAGYSSAKEVEQGNWAARNSFGGDDLAGKRVCIIGSGNIGQKTAALCRAFSAEVVVCGRGGNGLAGLMAALKAQLPISDVISLHIPLTPETKGLLNREVLSLCKPGSLLVNTARGELLDEDALLEALNQGTLGAYSADVMASEPPEADNALLAHPRTIVTPHVAALTTRTYRELCLFTAQNVAKVLLGEAPDPASLYQKAVS